ncbi:hypothetical protein KIN20_005377 [Parelaphostrongylus tenuis]|uniref:Uncharacterized protein n=1 Tax=Parelaphostrongylus tenuis TaxID=148309 RepID=A0AAD5QFZ4_PARTN|nr:hypothetical protein KIN20_005377 [Parelaphostrongylus tenuis]
MEQTDFCDENEQSRTPDGGREESSRPITGGCSAILPVGQLTVLNAQRGNLQNVHVLSNSGAVLSFIDEGLVRVTRRSNCVSIHFATTQCKSTD